MLPSAASAGFEDEPALTADEQRKKDKSKRMTTREKATAEKTFAARVDVFKRTIQAIGYESREVQTELKEVIEFTQTELTSVSKRIDDTSWKWLSSGGKKSMEDVSQEQVMLYKDVFSPEEWTGLLKTWNIVEDRARTTERHEVDPLEADVRRCRKRMAIAKELATLCDEFFTKFDNIFDDTDPIEQEMLQFIDRYNRLEDTSKSYKKHKCFDDGTLIRMLNDLMHPGWDKQSDDDEDGQSVVSSLANPESVKG